MKTRIIAEIASNHLGDVSLAVRFIEVAAQSGVDYVKFQSSRYEDLVNKNDLQADWIRKTSLTDETHFKLIEECQKNNVKFLTTCFSVSRVAFLSSLSLDEVKLASPDLLSFSMIERLSQGFKHLIISTGMHTKKDIKIAIDFLIKNKINATLMHAVSLYPTPLDKNFMYKYLWLKDSYPHVGFSNHCSSIEPIKFAMANGAEIVEAHLKLGQDGPGRATPFDILPDDFRELVSYRNTLADILGDEDWLDDEDFQFPDEKIAAQRFIGRWGKNE